MNSRVAASEAAMLTAVRLVLSGGSVNQLRVGLDKRERSLDRIGPTAMRILTDTLRKGAVAALARHGAWRPGRAQLEHGARTGRLWHLHPELRLLFGPASFSLCRWLVTADAALLAPKTVADELLFYLAAEALVRLGRRISDLAASPLVWLGYPDCLDREPGILDFSRLASGDGATIVQALHGHLEARYVAMERAKTAVASPERLIAIGRQQEAVLTAFFDAIDAAGRRDLATFAARAAARLTHRPASAWILGLAEGGSPLSERAEASRRSAAFLRLVGRLGAWRRQYAMVPFFDDGYGRAQRLMAEWEPLGQTGFARAEAIADELESLRGLGDTGTESEETT